MSMEAVPKSLLEPTTLHAETTLFFTYNTINAVFWL
jgi:hypothetical protein